MKELRIAAVAALAGVAALALWFSRFDSAARFPLSIDRAAAIRRAAGLTRKYGVDTTAWRVAATTQTDEKLFRYLEASAGDPVAPLFTPAYWAVQFRQPGGAHTVRVRLFADGRPAALLMERRDGEADDLGTPPATDPLADFAGASAPSFATVLSTAPGQEAWEWSGGGSFPLGARLDVRKRNGRVISAALMPRFERDVPRPAFLKWPAVAVGLLEFLGFCAALFYCVRGWTRGRFSWRMPAAFGVVLVVWSGILALSISSFDMISFAQDRVVVNPNNSGVNVHVDEEDPDLNSSGSGVESLLRAGAGALTLLFVFMAAAYSSADARSLRLWVSLELSSRRQFASREAAGPAATGALWGVCLAGLPYAIARVFATPLGMNALNVGAYRIPEAAVLSVAAAVPAFGFFGFAEPLAARVKQGWLRIGLIAGVLAVFATPKTSTYYSFAPAAALSIGTAAICVYLVRRLDLLALACAFLSAHAVYAVAALFAQPVSFYREHAAKALFLTAAGLAAPLYFALRGRSAAAVAASIEEDAASLIEDAGQSSRERLESEFQIARRAQQDALPMAPPVARGLSVAAVCEPAKQVGGDLYDFFTLPDGRIGVVVADVSGKGVPAALYMMVTKGLLAAVTRDSSDLRHILQSINTHLYRACKRRVFVTMAAVAVDPATLRVEHGRAGHNPIVWRRARRGETLLVKPSGLGLGMCAGETFARTLRLDAFEMEEGDAVILYSDGVTEAVNGVMEQFGEERLMRSVAAADGRSAEAIRAAVLRDLAAFCGGTPARDDVTVVAIRAEEARHSAAA